MSRKKKSEAWGQNGFEDWGGYMEAKKAKLEEQFHQEASKDFASASTLFQGIAIFVNGYTNPSADELRKLMMAHGGTYHHYMRPRVTTHIIASNLPYSKIVLYRKCQNPLPICKPEWITDSIKAGKILNFTEYLLYSNHTETQPQLNFIRTNKNNVTNTAFSNVENSLKTNSTVNSVVLQNDTDNTDTVIKSAPNEDKTVSSKPVASKNTARCTKNSEFLSEFYSNSRLHHIATMGATFKDYVNELRDKSNGNFLGLQKLIETKKLNKPGPSTRNDTDSEDESLYLNENDVKVNRKSIIMHIDMDCFFVSVGLRNRPELKGLPVAVTHAKNSRHATSGKSAISGVDLNDNDEHGSLSEVASCSYEARKCGVKNGMFLGQALKLCPNLKTIPYDFEGYTNVSYTLYNTVASYTLDIEAVSCDELYADCTNILERSGLTALEFATIIRNEINQKTGCPVSTGFGNNKLLARLATRKAKPNGQFYLKSEEAMHHIASFNVKDLPGVGYTTTEKLNAINVRTCAQMQVLSLGALQKDFGRKMGETLYNMCRGIDKSKLSLEHVRKSVSAEVNYGIRFENNGDAVDFLKKLSEEVCTRLKKANARGRCITLKLMVRANEAPKDPEKFMGHGLCNYFTRSKNLIAPIDDVTIITREVVGIWNQLHQPPEDARGIGIQISRLEISKHKSSINLIDLMKKQSELIDKESKNDDCSVKQNANVESDKSSKSKGVVTLFSKDFSQMKEPNKTSIKNTTTKDSLNLPCIYDKAVLAELPEDIKNEILSINGKHNFDISNTHRTSVKPISLNKVGLADKCFGSSKSELQSVCNVTEKCTSNIVVPSQGVDESILDALPEDIRTEIINVEAEKKKCENKCHENFKRARQKQSALANANPQEILNSESSDTIGQQNCENSSLMQSKDSNQVREVNEKSQILIPSQEIDESVLNALPPDLRSEIITMVSKTSSLESRNKPKSVQLHQEQFFKQTKSNSGKSGKVEMPPIQEVDMAVLIELPEDIRNEILNEYSMRKCPNTTSSSTTRVSKDPAENKHSEPVIINQNSDEKDADEGSISFSQIDPDFLAALSEDVRNDVRMYCMSKKREQELKMKRNHIQKNTTGIPGSMLQSGNHNVLKQDKKPSKSSKLKTSNNKNSKNKKNINIAQRNTEFNAKCESKTSDNKGIFTMDGRKLVLDTVDEEEAETIISHNRSIAENNNELDKHQEMLVKLVNHLFSLPLEQVKMQIQTWIARSETINEVDFLSLATFLSMLPGKKRIEDLHILMKTMHRCMTETGSCIWHKTYRKTVKHVQQYMQIEYNSDLMVPSIRCNLLNCDGGDVVQGSGIQ